MGVQTIIPLTRAAYGCLIAVQSLWARAWTVACTPALSVTQKAPLQLQLRLVALYKCYIPLPLAIETACNVDLLIRRQNRRVLFANAT